MRRLVLLLCLGCAAKPPPQVTPNLPGERTGTTAPATGLGRGSDAPDFALESSDGRVRGLGELRQAGPVLIFFYPGSYSDDAKDQLKRIQAKMRELPPGASVVGVSPDTKAVSAKLREELKLDLPLLSDVDLRAARAYRVADATTGVSLPALFVVDKQGKIRWSYRPGEGRHGEDEAFDALRLAQ
ncbi:MAG TPA: peroxiredoxin family protein [Haliangiales bacterium]|nr:peroxiredoxin family protein [Haliangiales bacterium]